MGNAHINEKEGNAVNNGIHGLLGWERWESRVVEGANAPTHPPLSRCCVYRNCTVSQIKVTKETSTLERSQVRCSRFKRT